MHVIEAIHNTNDRFLVELYQAVLFETSVSQFPVTPPRRRQALISVRVLHPRAQGNSAIAKVRYAS
jgi:hypothetical protein